MAAGATPTKNDPKRLATSGQLALATNTLYTAPAGERGARLTAIVLVNAAATSVTATLYLVESGGTADDTRILAKAVTVPADGFPVTIDVRGLIMNASDTLQGKASAATQVTYHVSGIEMAA